MKVWKNKKINYIFLILLTMGVLYFTLYKDFHNVVNVLLHVNLFWLFYAFVLILGYWFFRSLVLKKFTSKFKKGARFLNSFQLMMRTQFFNAVTPFATGGQPYQVYYLTKEGIRVSSATSIIMQNFIVYQIALVLLGLLAVIYNFCFHLFPKIALLQHLVTLGFIINALVVVVMFLVSFNKKIGEILMKIGIFVLTKLRIVKDREKKIKKWENSINEFHDSAKILLKNKKDFIEGILLNFIALISLYLIPYAMMLAIGENAFNSVDAIITSAYIMLLGSFVPMPGGTGGLEYGFISFYGNFITGSKLSALMILWRFLTYYLGIILGSIALNVKRVKQ